MNSQHKTYVLKHLASASFVSVVRSLDPAVDPALPHFVEAQRFEGV